MDPRRSSELASINNKRCHSAMQPRLSRGGRAVELEFHELPITLRQINSLLHRLVKRDLQRFIQVKEPRFLTLPRSLPVLRVFRMSQNSITGSHVGVFMARIIFSSRTFNHQFGLSADLRVGRWIMKSETALMNHSVASSLVP